MDEQKGLKSTELYFSDMETFDVMGEDERIELFKRLEKGDMSAKEELINGNLRLARFVTSKFISENSDNYLDYLQEGNLGLIRAIELFDYKKGNTFYTYAVYWIRQSIVRYIHNSEHIIRKPVYVNEITYKIEKAKEKLEKETGESSDLEEISRLTGLSIDKVEEHSIINNEISSLNDFVYNGDGDAEEVINFLVVDDHQDHFDMVIHDEMLEGCLSIVEGMNSKHKSIAIHYLLANVLGIRKKTLIELAEELGITHQRVGQIKDVVAKKLKSYILSYYQLDGMYNTKGVAR